MSDANNYKIVPCNIWESIFIYLKTYMHTAILCIRDCPKYINKHFKDLAMQLTTIYWPVKHPVWSVFLGREKTKAAILSLTGVCVLRTSGTHEFGFRAGSWLTPSFVFSICRSVKYSGLMRMSFNLMNPGVCYERIKYSLM